MFWQSVWNGFGLLSHWEVWAGVVFYVGGMFAYLLVLSRLAGNDEQTGRQIAGCLTNLILGPVVQGVLTALVVAFLLPFMLGGSRTLSLADIYGYFGRIVLAGIIGVVTAILIGLIPVVGQMLTDAPGVQTFIIGAVVFRLLAGSAVQRVLERAGQASAAVYPSVWLTLGYIGIAVALVYATTLLVALVAARSEGSAGGIMTVVVGPAIGALGGLLTLFMYSAYVVRALLAALGR